MSTSVTLNAANHTPSDIRLALASGSSLASLSLVRLTLLLLGVVLPHTAVFTRLLHRLGAAYLGLSLFRWLDPRGGLTNSGATVVLQGTEFFSLNPLSLRQADALFPRLFVLSSTLLLIIFLAGTAERFLFSRRAEREFPLLVLFLHLGGLLALRASTGRDLFLALERVTLASYVLVSFERQSRFSTYAGVQYFLLGSLPSARLLLGLSLLYFQAGSLVLQDRDLLFTEVNLSPVASAFPLVDLIGSSGSSAATESFVSLNHLETLHFLDSIESIPRSSFGGIESLLASVAPLTAVTGRAAVVLLFNLLFKVTAAPFHLWAPSVYGKAPIASVTLLSIYSKVRALLLLLKLLRGALHAFAPLLAPALLVCGLLSVAVGRLGAFLETVTKRFFVYSSRGHVGFRLLGLSLRSIEGATASVQYLPVYVLSSLRRWFLLLQRGRSASSLAHLSQLTRAEPLLALTFGLLLFSRSGIPPFGGFFVKLDLLAALLEAGRSFTAYLLFFATVGSFFYYLRLLKILFFDESQAVVSALTSETVSGSLVNGGNLRPAFRIWTRRVGLLILGAYILLVQPPLLSIQSEVVGSLFLSSLLSHFLSIVLHIEGLSP